MLFHSASVPFLIDEENAQSPGPWSSGPARPADGPAAPKSAGSDIAKREVDLAGRRDGEVSNCLIQLSMVGKVGNRIFPAETSLGDLPTARQSKGNRDFRI